MSYTLIISRAGKEDLVFKRVIFFLAEPGRVKIRTNDWREQSVEWRTIEEVTGLILHEEKDNE